MKADYTRLSIDIPHELHKVMKFHIIENHLNIKNYVLNLIKDDLSEELEDYALGQMALRSEKEGYLGAEESKKFLKESMKLLGKNINKKSTKKSHKNERNKHR